MGEGESVLLVELQGNKIMQASILQSLMATRSWRRCSGMSAALALGYSTIKRHYEIYEGHRVESEGRAKRSRIPVNSIMHGMDACTRDEP